MVGFNFIIEAERHAMKRRLLNGEFGAVKRVAFSAWLRAPPSISGAHPGPGG